MWFEPYIDTYDRRGELFRSHIYWLATRDRPVPDARVAIYPFKRSFVVGAVSTDVQSGQATMCYLPGLETPERECWYINMGAVDRNFFTTDAMVRAASSRREQNAKKDGRGTRYRARFLSTIRILRLESAAGSSLKRGPTRFASARA